MDEIEERSGLDPRQPSRRTVLKGTAAGVATAAGLPVGRVAATAGTDATTDFPQFQYDPANTGHVPDGQGPVANVTEKWEFGTGDDTFQSSPAVVDGTVYVGSADHSLYAIDAESGDEQWSFEVDDAIVSSPAVGDGVVYFGGLDGRVYAADAETGEQKWRFDFGTPGEPDGQVRHSPTIADGNVYVDDYLDLISLDADSGDVIWRFETEPGENVRTPASVAGGRVYFGTGEGNVYSVNDDGTEAWSTGIDAWIESPPAVADGKVFLLGGDRNAYAFDADDGSELWRFEKRWGDEDTRNPSSPAVADRTVFVGGHDQGRVFALAADDGSVEWKRDLGGVDVTSPVVVNGVVFVGASTVVHALSAYDGSTLWTHEAPRATGTPTVVDGDVYFGCHDTNVYALEGDTTNDCGLEPAVAEADTSEDCAISTSELRTAIGEWATGGYTSEEMGRIIRAWATGRL